MTDTPAGAVRALLALWNDVDPAREDEYNDWHGSEHVPERLTVPGILWARRWRAPPRTGDRAEDGANPGPRYLTLYSLASLAVLDSAAYRRLLAEPTPWSRRMRPNLCGLSRWVCTIEADGVRGGVDGARLQVQCLPDAPLPPAVPATALLARRQPQAAALPWLADAQAADIPGGWLVCCDDDAGVAGSAALYRRRFERLPVGRGTTGAQV